MSISVAPGLAGAQGQSWTDRLRPAAYTSPRGTRIEFKYEAVGREFDKRTTAYEFPGVDGSYVQQQGYSARKYPMRCFIWGPDHDLIATAFEAALLETGIGRLEHPLYGPVDVVPFGQVTRRDDLKNEANQSVIEVTFWTTLRVLYPSSQAHPQSEILSAIANFNVVAAQQFANSSDLRTSLTKAAGKSGFRKFLGDVSNALQSVSDSVQSVNRKFRDIQDGINEGMDVFIGQPLLLARQVSDLIQAPARALRGFDSRLDAYGRLADSIFGSDAGNPQRALASGSVLALRTSEIANAFLTSDLFALSVVAGLVVAAVAPPINEEGQTLSEPLFKTKPEALAAADAILALFDRAIAWRDNGYRQLQGIAGVKAYQVDTGEAYQALSNAAALTAGYLVEISFSLLPERRIVLDRPRTIIDLAAELYGSVDDKLDFLISTNALSGDEIFEIPRGRMIVYYKA